MTVNGPTRSSETKSVISSNTFVKQPHVAFTAWAHVYITVSNLQIFSSLPACNAGQHKREGGGCLFVVLCREIVMLVLLIVKH